MSVIARLRRNVPPHWLVFFVVVVDLIGFGIVIPILPFLSPALGGNETDVAAIIIMFSVCAALVATSWGRLSDHFGRKPVLLICLVGGALSYVMLGLATELWMVYAARAFAGLMSGSLAVATALMADLSPPEKRARAMGLVGSAFGIGLVLGPVLGGLLAGDGSSFLLPCVFAGGVSLLAVVLGALLLPGDGGLRSSPTKAPPRVSLWTLLRRGGNGLLILQYVFHTMAVSSAIYMFPLWTAGELNWGPADVGLFFGLVGVSMIVIQGGMLDWLTRRFGLLNVLRAGAGSFAVFLALLGVSYTLPSMAGAMFLAFTGATVCLPLLNTISSSVVEADLRGQMMGATAAAASAGRIFGPSVSAAALALGGYRFAWVVVALVVMLVFIWSVTVAQRYAGVGQHPPSPEVA